MSITGLPGQGPVRVGIPVADLGAGIFCAMGILVALLEREVSGEGQWVQSSLLGAQISLLDFQAARWLIAKDVPGQAGNDHPTSIPTGVFPTSDGHINIAAAGKHIYTRFCETLGLTICSTIRASPRIRRARRTGRPSTRSSPKLPKSTRAADLIAKLNKAGVPCGPINRMDEVFADPQVQHLGMAAPVHHGALGDIAVVNQPVKLSRTPSRIARATPEKGEHTDEILKTTAITTSRLPSFARGRSFEYVAVIASQRVGAKRRPMINSAKQSSWRSKKESWIAHMGMVCVNKPSSLCLRSEVRAGFDDLVCLPDQTHIRSSFEATAPGFRLRRVGSRGRDHSSLRHLKPCNPSVRPPGSTEADRASADWFCWLSCVVTEGSASLC